MTREERNNKLKHFITCLKCEVSGKPCNVNCSTQYEAGNMGEFIENLEAISKALEQEPILDKIRTEIEQNAYPIVHGVNNHENGMTLYGILQIIDKYREVIE